MIRLEHHDNGKIRLFVMGQAVQMPPAGQVAIIRLGDRVSKIHLEHLEKGTGK